MQINLLSTPFLPRLIFRYLSLLLVAFQVLIFIPLLSIEDLAIFFLLKSFIETMKRVFSGLSGVGFYQSNYKKNSEALEDIILHFFVYSLISLFTALSITLLIYIDSITINIFNYFSSITYYDYIFFIIWMTFSLASKPGNHISQIFGFNKLTGFITVFSPTFFTSVIALIFYLKSNINLTTFLFSFGIGNFINFLLISLFVFKNIKIKKIRNKTFKNFLKMTNLSESLLGFTTSLRMQSILWFLSYYNENTMLIIIGFYNWFFPLIFYPSQAIFTSLRSTFFSIVDSKNNLDFKNFIDKISFMNASYFSVILIIVTLAYFINENMMPLQNFSNISFLLYSRELCLLLISIFSAYFLSALFFKHLNGVVAHLKKFNQMIVINLLSTSVLYSCVLFSGNLGNLDTWLFAIFTAQLFHGFSMNFYLFRILRIL